MIEICETCGQYEPLCDCELGCECDICGEWFVPTQEEMDLCDDCAALEKKP